MVGVYGSELHFPDFRNDHKLQKILDDCRQAIYENNSHDNNIIMLTSLR